MSPDPLHADKWLTGVQSQTRDILPRRGVVEVSEELLSLKIDEFEFEFMICFLISSFLSRSQQVYLSIPEYGFTSKLMSAKKPKRFVPNTPAKKNKSHASQEIYSPFANILHFSDETQEDSSHKHQHNNRKMKVTTV